MVSTDRKVGDIVRETDRREERYRHGEIDTEKKTQIRTHVHRYTRAKRTKSIDGRTTDRRIDEQPDRPTVIRMAHKPRNPY
jgi:hypothetical protein